MYSRASSMLRGSSATSISAQPLPHQFLPGRKTVHSGHGVVTLRDIRVMEDAVNQFVFGKIDRHRNVQFLAENAFRTLRHEPSVIFFAPLQRLFRLLSLGDVDCRSLHQWCYRWRPSVQHS